MEDSFIIEWSASQKAFHLHKASEMLERNLSNIISGHNSDFVPILSFYSLTKATQALSDLNKKVIADGSLNLRELQHVLLYLIND
ncbi:MAG: hypothetical protein ACXWT3_11155 [Methylococcaceae bacterium]